MQYNVGWQPLLNCPAVTLTGQMGIKFAKLAPFSYIRNFLVDTLLYLPWKCHNPDTRKSYWMVHIYFFAKKRPYFTLVDFIFYFKERKKTQFPTCYDSPMTSVGWKSRVVSMLSIGEYTVVQKSCLWIGLPIYYHSIYT